MKYTTTTTVAYGVPFLGYVILFYVDPSFHGKRSILVFRYLDVHVISGDAFSAHDVLFMLLVSKNAVISVVLQAMLHFSSILIMCLEFLFQVKVPYLFCLDFLRLDSLRAQARRKKI